MYRTARPAQCVRVIKERSNHITVAATLFYILNEIALNNPLRDNLTNARQVGQILVILSHKGAAHKMIRILLSRKLGEIRWTQAELARVTGIRPTTINELYHELAERVNLEHLDLICEALGCELDEIIIRLPNTISKIDGTKAGNKRRHD